MPKANLELPHIAYSGSSYEAAEGAEAILVLTEWDEFRSINWQNLAKEVARRLIIDGRNLFSSDEDASNGFQ